MSRLIRNQCLLSLNKGYVSAKCCVFAITRKKKILHYQGGHPLPDFFKYFIARQLSHAQNWLSLQQDNSVVTLQLSEGPIASYNLTPTMKTTIRTWRVVLAMLEFLHFFSRPNLPAEHQKV